MHVEGFVKEKADAVLGVELDDVEREVIGELEVRPGGQQRLGGAGNGVDEFLVVVAERVDVLATARTFEARVEVCQGGRTGVNELSQDWV